MIHRHLHFSGQRNNRCFIDSNSSLPGDNQDGFARDPGRPWIAAFKTSTVAFPDCFLLTYPADWPYHSSELHTIAQTPGCSEIQQTGGQPAKASFFMRYPLKTRQVVLDAALTLMVCLLLAFSPAINVRTAWADDSASDPDVHTFTTLDSLFTRYQPYLENISAHEPVYFLRGVNPEKSKFQLSMKYRFINPSMTLSQRYPWTRGFYFA